MELGELGQRTLGKHPPRGTPLRGHIGHLRVVAMLALPGRIDRVEPQIIVEDAIAKGGEARILADRRGRICLHDRDR